MRWLVWGTCPWNQTTLLCLFFSASFYYRLFLPNTLKGAGAECTCEVVGTEKCDKALRMSSFWIYSISRSFYLIMPKTKKKSEILCTPASVTLAVPCLHHCWELGLMASFQRLSLSRTEMLKYSFQMWSFLCRTSGSFVLQPMGGVRRESLAKRLSARSWRGWAVSETQSSYDSPLPQSVNFSLLLQDQLPFSLWLLLIFKFAQ